VPCAGGKIELARRIESYLLGQKLPVITGSKKKTSIFDWNKEVLTTSTIITDNYKNTENVRVFFKNILGAKFHFTVDFMNWMKAGCGKNLAVAAAEWPKIHQQKKRSDVKKTVAPQFEYNRYIRDFVADNPDLTIKHAIKVWQKKKQLPNGTHYDKKDIGFLES
jgi:Domain of unknown function (DUF6434)